MTTIENNLDLGQQAIEELKAGYKEKIRQHILLNLDEILRDQKAEFNSEEDKEWWVNKWVDEFYIELMKNSTVRLKDGGGSDNIW